MKLGDTTTLSKILKYANFFTTNDGIYSNFFFTGDGVVATNGSFLFKSLVADVPNATLPSKNIMKFLSVCPSGSIEWYPSTDNSYITFQSDSYTANIPNVFISEIPSPKKLFGEPIARSIKQDRIEFKITNQIIQGLEQLSFCRPSNDAGKQEIQGVRFEPEGLFATDSYGIVCELIPTGVTYPFTLPSKLVDFIIQYGMEPVSCFLTADNILIKYPRIIILGRMPNLEWPDLSSKIMDFKEEYYMTIKESESSKKATLKRMSTAESINLMIVPKSPFLVELSMQDITGGDLSEVVQAENNLPMPISVSFKCFRGGYIKANHIKMARFNGSSMQLLFEDNSFRYTILSRIV